MCKSEVYDLEWALAFIQECQEKSRERSLAMREMEREKSWIRKNEIGALLWLASALDLHPEKLIRLLLVIRKNEKGAHKVFYKNKNNRRKKIVAPSVYLSIVQKKIAELFFKDSQRSRNSFGFLGGNTHQALEPHCFSKSILMVDIREAFPSVKKENIARLLKEQKRFSWYVANVMADILTYQGSLTRGFSTSPLIFELLCANMDRRLQHLAENVGGVYTRYADNILFFNSKKKNF
jgi:RNA-directed DNA polymerase